MGRAKIVACGLIGAFGLFSAGCGGEPALCVGSKNFTEQVILGEIVAQHLEHRLKRNVDRKLNLGGTLLVHQALVGGQLDVYPEYTGTALAAVLKLQISNDPAVVANQVRERYRSEMQLEWLEPLGFNNSFIMAIHKDDPAAKKLETLSDAETASPGWKLGVGYEFETRPDGLVALHKVYDLPSAGPPVTMDLGLLYKALQEKKVNMIAANATDGMLRGSPVKVLKDDKRAFPPYQAALVVRAAALQKFPGMKKALDELSGKFSEETMRELNFEVDGKHAPVVDVAAGFLRKAGLL